MRIVGIVCEYNPFHRGHQFHIEEVRRQLKADVIVCVMSGNFVQRGELAMFEKFLRAQMAVKGGADLVLELPLLSSLQSAEKFADHAVSLLHGLGCIDFLSFGAETADIELLTRAATLLTGREVEKRTLELLKSGVNYPKARQEALSELDPAAGAVLDSPNNILAVEYIRSLRALASPIKCMVTKRVGAGHDQPTGEGGYASASFIRSMLKIGVTEGLWDYLSESSAELMRSAMEAGRFLPTDEGTERAILATLRRLSPEDFAAISDVSEGLHNRLFEQAMRAGSYGEFICGVATKRYPQARIRRIVMRAMLGITREVPVSRPPYLRPLAMNEKGTGLLRYAKKYATLPILTKPAHIEGLSEEAKLFFAFERRGSAVYHAFYKKEENRRDADEFLRTPHVL